MKKQTMLIADNATPFPSAPKHLVLLHLIRGAHPSAGSTSGSALAYAQLTLQRLEAHG